MNKSDNEQEIEPFRRCACPVWDAHMCLTIRQQLPRNYYPDALGIEEVCDCACHTSDDNPYYRADGDTDDDDE